VYRDGTTSEANITARPHRARDRREDTMTMERPGIHSEVLRYVELFDLPRETARILDYGCGAGGAVLALRERGYQAFGVDIDAGEVAAANAALAAAGYGDNKDLCGVLDETGRAPFEAGGFDLVFSQQVFEHVEDLTVVAQELERLTKPGGYGFHVFPPRRRPQESHYFMPFVHWLPKNRLRHAAMLAYAALGLGGRPPEIPGAGPRQRAAFLYRYSVERTFYRPHPEIARTLREAGLDTCFAVTNHRRLRANPVLRRIVDLPLLRPVVEWGLLTVVGVNLLTRRPSAAATAPAIVFGSWRGAWQPARAVSPQPSAVGHQPSAVSR
jgi:SAM-dependent methyltransferase